jgi:hypothetical protein
VNEVKKKAEFSWLLWTRHPQKVALNACWLYGNETAKSQGYFVVAQPTDTHYIPDHLPEKGGLGSRKCPAAFPMVSLFKAIVQV